MGSMNLGHIDFNHLHSSMTAPDHRLLLKQAPDSALPPGHTDKMQARVFVACDA